MADAAPGKPAERVLVVVEEFPATGGSRIDKFVRYLPEAGIEPVVLSPAETVTVDTEQRRRELYPPGLVVRRARSIGWSYFTNRFLARGPGSRHYELLRVLSYPERALFVPDHMVRWIPLGLVAARRLVRDLGIRVVLTSSPSESCHLLGLALQREFGTRWIADFRDLWTEKSMLFRPASRWHDRLVHRLERLVFERADHVIANTPQNLARYLARFDLAGRVTLIPNGFDPEEAATLPTAPPQPRDAFRLGYAGNIDKHGLPWKMFLDALRGLADEVGRERVRLDLCGYCSDEVIDYLRRQSMEDIVVRHGELPHRQAMRVIAGCDVEVALLYENTSYSDSIVPLKLYNYVMLRRPILFVGPVNGAAADIVRDTRTGVVLPPRGAEPIREWMLGSFRSWSRGELRIAPDEAAIARFDARSQTAELARIIRGG